MNDPLIDTAAVSAAMLAVADEISKSGVPVTMRDVQLRVYTKLIDVEYDAATVAAALQARAASATPDEPVNIDTVLTDVATTVVANAGPAEPV